MNLTSRLPATPTFLVALTIGACSAGAAPSAEAPPPAPSAPAGAATVSDRSARFTTPAPRHRNLFSEQLGVGQAEIDAKIEAAWKHLFYGDDKTERVYYPVGTDMAYIADTGNEDVRSEGMSYGMMIAVQLNRQEEFNRLWKWARTHMYHKRGPLRGYFAWHCSYDGRQLDAGSASDGEEWFATALFFAAARWPGGEGIFDYQREAQALLRSMLHDNPNPDGPPTSLFDRERHQVVFVPSPAGRTFTDPSYHLPAFYELWARWADQDNEFWAKAATTSRDFFKRAAHPKTGLMPEYANFDGTPRPGERGDFRFDAWRILSNVALDYDWFQRDPWAIEQSNRVLRFLASQGPRCPNQFTLDGKPLSDEPSLGLFSMAAVAGLAADPALSRPFTEYLWNAKAPSGTYRYYDGLLYLLALLEVSGEFRIHTPAQLPSSNQHPS